ncbi:hypothetical protein CLV51_103619 [Chitinophaga niastensis]|uniref:Uncharacterized protein n=1 Tax=Chitinophaga niastensis TaxID=536980 RepID=A0A2P8HK92_CHINA|nr:hypothetical protein [Chitinophaga niastensis]PSL46638.1 hypothetical protein CLV51_103619 [Chitinophaga niastensis]
MNEHNPIAQEINKIQAHWRKAMDAHPDLHLVRLMIKPEEARVYEGFCKLESTSYGQLEEVFVTHLTSFENEDTFSAAIIKDWLETYDSSTTLLQEMEQRGAPLLWDATPFRQSLTYDPNIPQDALLLQLLQSFRAALPHPPRQLVLALLPRQVSDTRSFAAWLTTLLRKGIPAGVKLLVLDHVGKDHLLINDRPFPGQLLSIHVPLQLENAIQKLATAGNPNDPEIQFRKCLFEMGAALQDKDLKRLHYWGQRMLDCTQQSGNKGLFATAHISYAGMLFNFKREPQIPLLLEKGSRIAKQGMLQGDPACLPLVIQFYGYQGAYAQLRKRFTEAIDWYIQQATLAQQHKFLPQAMNAWYQAAELCRRKDSSRYYTVLEQAWESGKQMTDDEITASVYSYLVRDYHDYAYTNKLSNVVQQIEETMGRIFGKNWKEEIDRMKKANTRMIMQPQIETETEDVSSSS